MPGFRVMGSTSSSELAQDTDSAWNIFSVKIFFNNLKYFHLLVTFTGQRAEAIRGGQAEHQHQGEEGGGY